MVNGVKEVTFEETELLPKPLIGQETIEYDSSISRVRVESILRTIMTGVLQFFKNYTKACSSFCYKIKYINEGQPEAILWATLEMRRDLIRYSDAVFLDMCKTAMNNSG